MKIIKWKIQNLDLSSHHTLRHFLNGSEPIINTKNETMPPHPDSSIHELGICGGSLNQYPRDTEGQLTEEELGKRRIEQSDVL